MEATPVMGRRRFLRGVGLAAAGGASASLWGCAGPGRRTASSSRSTTSAPTTTTGPPPDAADWGRLAATLSGRLVLPTNPDYGRARLLYDPRFDGLAPQAVAYCASPTDVQRCLAFARAHGVQPAPRCGGHSYAGYSSGDGLVLDVTSMRDVTVSPTAARATVGAGTRLVDFYAQLSASNVLVPAGSCPSVGIAGLALGGGIGVLARKYGLTCDAIDAVQVVVADGRVLDCDAHSNTDLYWACRGGGGGNFGVVTSFTFHTDPIPELALFTVDWPWAAAADVLGAWMDWQHQAPDELWSNCQLASSGSGGLGVRSAGVFVGSSGALGSLVDQLVRGVGSTPQYRFVGPEQFPHAMLVEAGCENLDVAQCHLTTNQPPGVLDRTAMVASSAYLSAIPPSAGIAALVGAVEDLHATLPSFGGGLAFDAYGGAINAVPAAGTAFVHRDAVCAIQATVATGASTAAVSEGRGWLAHFARSAAPYVDGSAYQNYIDPTLTDWQQAYYGSNLGRLVAVKERYDPDDVFHFAQSIPTSLKPASSRPG
jgi:FAD/FMN-containing dehydrogenase